MASSVHILCILLHLSYILDPIGIQFVSRLNLYLIKYSVGSRLYNFVFVSCKVTLKYRHYVVSHCCHFAPLSCRVDEFIDNSIFFRLSSDNDLTEGGVQPSSPQDHTPPSKGDDYSNHSSSSIGLPSAPTSITSGRIAFFSKSHLFIFSYDAR